MPTGKKKKREREREREPGEADLGLHRSQDTRGEDTLSQERSRENGFLKNERY